MIKRFASAVVLGFVLSGCASWFPQMQSKQSGSVVEYLYGSKATPAAMLPEVTTLKLPVRVGVAFVPSQTWSQGGITESDRMRLLDRVKAAFSGRDYIADIEVIPGNYLNQKGGFANLEQAARMFNVDVVVLLSYDQVQFNDSNALSILYWTVMGAYLIHGDQYDIQTMLEAAVLDVRSRKLLFRAPGTSSVKGSAALVSFSEKSRAARQQGYDQALDSLIPNLQRELDVFRERVKAKAQKGVQIEYRDGARGGGDLGWPGLLGLALLAWMLVRNRRN